MIPPEIYRGWRIYESLSPSPLWTATKRMEKDLYSYEGLDAIKRYIDRRMVADALREVGKEGEESDG